MSYDVENLIIPGCFLTGLGFGFMFDHEAAGAIIGLGIGFVIGAFFNTKEKKKKTKDEELLNRIEALEEKLKEKKK